MLTILKSNFFFYNSNLEKLEILFMMKNLFQLKLYFYFKNKKMLLN